MAKRKKPVDPENDDLPVPKEKYSDVAETKKSYADSIEFWLSEIESAKKREKDFRKNGKRIREIYSGAKKESTPFNILFANTEIVAPALYSQVPRPVVERRFKDSNPLGMAASTAAQRGLEFMLDTNIDGYDTFHEAMKASVLDGCLPGRGVTGLKYDPKIEGEYKVAENVCTEITNWDKVYFGYAKKWTKVPWMAFEIEIDEEEAERLFGKAIAEEIEFTTPGETDDDGEKKTSKDLGAVKTTVVYQIWDKNGGRKIRYVSASYKEDFLKVEDDPLGLTGFFRIPQPLQFVEKTADMVPTAMYTLYENQAEELNRLTVRINKLVSAMKARGLYDSSLGDDVDKLMDGDDNELVPTEKGNSLAAERGLSGAIWFMPLEVLQATLQQLYLAREQCKQVIYEIMGISDIVRGASKASETLGAQQLKSQWGTMRMKTKQAEVQRYARDLLRMMLEIAASKFSQETWAKMTGLPYLTDMQFQQAQMIAMAAQQQAMIEQQSGQPGPATQQLQQVQQQLKQPKWSDVLGILKDDLQRAYRIDIETNSTIEPEAAEDQKQISELMNAIGQFVNGIGPMIEKGVMPFDMAKAMLLAITKRFRFGAVVEGMLDGMQPPKPEDNGEKEKAAQAMQQAQKDKADNEAKLRDAQSKLAAAQEQLKLVERETALELDKMRLESDKQKLDYEKKLFQIEQKVAHESVVKNASMASKELDNKKQIIGLEQKQVKSEQVTAQKIDSKTGEAVAKLSGALQQLVQTQQTIAETVQQHGEQIQEIAKIANAPRKRRAIRGPDGFITHTVDEPVVETH